MIAHACEFCRNETIILCGGNLDLMVYLRTTETVEFNLENHGGLSWCCRFPPPLLRFVRASFENSLHQRKDKITSDVRSKLKRKSDGHISDYPDLTEKGLNHGGRGGRGRVTMAPNPLFCFVFFFF